MEAAQFQTCLYRTVKKWRDTKITDRENGLPYDTFKMYRFGTLFLEILGKELLTQDISILDVGSGLSKSAHLLIGDAHISKYHSIDRADSQHDSFLNSQWDQIKDRQHFRRDIYKDDLIGDLHTELYDVVIIDIEPHGNEVTIYEKIQEHMKETHLCILKCIGHLDLYGSSLADKFIGHFIRSGHVDDYFAETSLNPGYRDIFVIMSRSKTDLDTRCQGLAEGKPTTWADPEISGLVLENREKDQRYIRDKYEELGIDPPFWFSS